MLQAAKRADVPASCAACAARLNGMCGVLSTEQLASLARLSARREAGEGARLLDDPRRRKAMPTFSRAW